MNGRIYSARGKKPPSEGKSAPAVLSVFTLITTYVYQHSGLWGGTRWTISLVDDVAEEPTFSAECGCSANTTSWLVTIFLASGS